MPVSPDHPHVEQHTEGKTRDLPISKKLADVLEAAAIAAGIDTVWIYSGGQCAKGTCSKRTGSTRHDLGAAADLHLVSSGSPLDFNKTKDRDVFATFLEACAKQGAEGIGAAADYMGSTSAHIGFGGRAVWGRNGKSANAPDWVKRAVAKGWASRSRTQTEMTDAEEAALVDELIETMPDSPNAEVEPLSDAFSDEQTFGTRHDYGDDHPDKAE